MITIQWKELNYAQFDRRAIRSAFGKTARVMTRNLKAIGASGGGGFTYTINGRPHTASAPGGPPARLTGNFVRSMKGRASRRGYALVVAAVAPHSHLLELGTQRAAARPSFEPTFADRGVVIAALQQAYAAAPVGKPGAPGSPPKEVEIN